MNADVFSFHGKKPSMKQCIAQAKRMAKAGADHLELQWGENWLQLMRQSNGYWAGFGFIRDIDAQMIARELNHSDLNPMQFMRDHFTIVHIQ